MRLKFEGTTQCEFRSYAMLGLNLGHHYKIYTDQPVKEVFFLPKNFLVEFMQNSFSIVLLSYGPSM